MSDPIPARRSPQDSLQLLQARLSAQTSRDEAVREIDLGLKRDLREDMHPVAKGLMQGVHNVRGMGHGLAGAVQSAVGAKEAAGRSFTRSSRAMEDAETYGSDLKVFDAEPGKGAFDSGRNFGQWVGHTTGQLLPFMAEVAAAGVLGGLAGSQVVPGIGPDDVVAAPAGAVAGAGARIFGKKVLREMIENQAEKFIKRGIIKEATKEATEEAAKKAATAFVQANIQTLRPQITTAARRVASRWGSKAMATLASASMEASGMWADGMKQGYDNPYSALALGLLSGASETFMGNVPLGMKTFLGGGSIGSAARKALDKAAMKGGPKAAAGFIWDIAKNMGEEGLQEGFQEMLQSVNAEINDPNFKITNRETWIQWAEASAAGALGGVVFALPAKTYSAVRSRLSQKDGSGATDLTTNTPLSVSDPTKLDPSTVTIEQLAEIDEDREMLRFSDPKKAESLDKVYTQAAMRLFAGITPFDASTMFQTPEVDPAAEALTPEEQSALPLAAAQRGEQDRAASAREASELDRLRAQEAEYGATLTEEQNTFDRGMRELDAIPPGGRERREETEAQAAIASRIDKELASFDRRMEGVPESFLDDNADLFDQMSAAIDANNLGRVRELANIIGKKARNIKGKNRPESTGAAPAARAETEASPDPQLDGLPQDFLDRNRDLIETIEIAREIGDAPALAEAETALRRKVVNFKAKERRKARKARRAEKQAAKAAKPKMMRASEITEPSSRKDAGAETSPNSMWERTEMPVEDLFGKSMSGSLEKTADARGVPDLESRMAKLEADIKENGIRNPIVVRPVEGDDFYDVEGNHRLLAAKRLGMTKVPVYILRKDEPSAKSPPPTVGNPVTPPDAGVTSQRESQGGVRTPENTPAEGEPSSRTSEPTRTKPKTVEEAVEREADQKIASEFGDSFRQYTANEALRRKKIQFVEANSKNLVESRFIREMIGAEWDRALESVEAGRVSTDRAAELAGKALEAGLTDEFNAKRFGFKPTATAKPEIATPAPAPSRESEAPDTEVSDTRKQPNAESQSPTPAVGLTRPVEPAKKAPESLQQPIQEKVKTISGNMTFDEFVKAGYAPNEVTRSEWVALQRSLRRSLGQDETSGTRFAPYADYEEYHRADVERALKAGENVDERVLADYPDLKKRYAKAEGSEQTATDEEWGEEISRRKDYLLRIRNLNAKTGGKYLDAEKAAEAWIRKGRQEALDEKPISGKETPDSVREALGEARKETATAKKAELAAFTSAFDSRDVAALSDMLRPDNKNLRAEWATRTGKKLPPTLSKTRAAIQAWAEAKPIEIPTNIEVDTISVDTFNNWRRSAIQHGQTNGWSIMTGNAGAIVAMRKTKRENAAGGGYVEAQMTSRFDSVEAAKAWAEADKSPAVVPLTDANRESSRPSKKQESNLSDISEIGGLEAGETVQVGGDEGTIVGFHPLKNGMPPSAQWAVVKRKGGGTFEMKVESILNERKAAVTRTTAPAATGPKEIGKNSSGHTITEDENGVRTVRQPAEGGRTSVVTEAVRLIPTRAGVATRPSQNRADMFLTAEELAAKNPAPAKVSNDTARATVRDGLSLAMDKVRKSPTLQNGSPDAIRAEMTSLTSKAVTDTLTNAVAAGDTEFVAAYRAVVDPDRAGFIAGIVDDLYRQRETAKAAEQESYSAEKAVKKLKMNGVTEDAWGNTISIQRNDRGGTSRVEVIADGKRHRFSDIDHKTISSAQGEAESYLRGNVEFVPGKVTPVKTFTYGLRARPMGLGTGIPTDFISHDPDARDEGRRVRHGTVTFSRELTKDEVSYAELVDMNEAPAQPPAETRAERREAERAEEDAELADLFKQLKGLRSRVTMGVDPDVAIIGTKIAAVYMKKGIRNFRDFAAGVRDNLGADWEKFKKYLHSFWSGATAANSDAPFFDEIEDVTFKQAQAIISDLDNAKTVDPTAEKADNKDGEATNENAADNEDNRNANPQGGPEGTLLRNGHRRKGSGGDAPFLAGFAPEDDAGSPGGESGTAAGASSGGTGVRGDGRGNREADNATDGRTGTGGAELVPDGTGRAKRGGSGGSRRNTDADRKIRKPSTAVGQPNYRITDPESLVGGGPKEKFERNRLAIETAQTIAAEGRIPTEAERDIMASYIGWGSFGQQLFDGTWERRKPQAGWEKEDAWLREHLGEEEWKSAQKSIINAHYTDPPTVVTMWNMVRQMGFTGGKVLEPSLGIGNFFGLMPADIMENSDLTGIELDQLTGGMAKLLYPQANIQIKGYEASQTPDNFYDLIIGNWPFSEIGPADRRYNKIGPSLHDYFFLKALDQVREGGIVIGITSTGTLDKVDKSVRLEMSKKADLVAAYRLPTGAFGKYAGTKVVTDIIILKKKTAVLGEGIPEIPSWVGTKEVDTPSGTKVRVNSYYAENPGNILGRLNFGQGTTTFRPGMIVERQADFESVLTKLHERLPANTYQADITRKTRTYVTNNSQDRVGSVLIGEDGGLYVSMGEQMTPLNEVSKYKVKSEKETSNREAQIRHLVSIRKALGKLIDEQREGSDTVEDTRRQTRELYESFVEQYGRINDSQALKHLKKTSDPHFAQLAALEIDTAPKGKDPIYQPATILTRSTMRAKPTMENPTVFDAYLLHRNSSLEFDAEAIAEMSGTTSEAVIDELTTTDTIYRLPGGTWTHADEYLSGNVRLKLREALAARDMGVQGMERNISALEVLVPEDIPYFMIEAKMGAGWINRVHYQTFIAHMLGLEGTTKTGDIEVSMGPQGWTVRMPSHFNHRPEVAQYGHEDVPFSRLVQYAMRNIAASIRRKDSEGNEYLDVDATEKANEKIKQMQEYFSSWVWSAPERQEELTGIYNDTFNGNAAPHYSGNFLRFEGMMLQKGDSPFNLRQHQISAIARGLITGRGLYAHEVGTGKTFTMAGLAIESRRYGKAKKPLLFAHNANSATVAREINEMYPGAKVLYVDNLAKNKKDVVMAQIVNDDWDVVVVPHSMMDRFALRKETYEALAASEIAELEAAAMQAASEDGYALTEDMMDSEEAMKKVRSHTAKQLVKQRERIKARIEKMSQKASENAIILEDAGIDMIIVDEAHEFKKPPIATSMQMKGLNKDTSDKSINMMFLLDYVAQINGGKGVHLFTGTPITNALNEIYNMMRFVMPNEMREKGVFHWDSWFNTFAAETTDIEVTSVGDYAPIKRLASFVNVPELRLFSGEFIDTVFAEDMPEFKDRTTSTGKVLKDPTLTPEEREELVSGRSENPQGRPYKIIKNVVVQMTPAQKGIQGYLRKLADYFRKASPKERMEIQKSGGEAMPIRVETSATKAGLDARLYNKDLPDDPGSKVQTMLKTVLDHYNEHPLATQAIFMDDGGYSDSTTTTERTMVNDEVVKTKIKVDAFNLSKFIVEELVARGIPEDQIAIVNGAVSKERRKEIADAMNLGHIRVVIGSTDTLGTGVNMQNNLRAMHHINAPWTPGELEQRNGRGHRQGNKWNAVMEYRYITEGIDGRRWQVLVVKDRFIKAFLKKTTKGRIIEGDAASIEDDGGNDMLATLSEATGDPRILQIAKAKKDIERLEKRKALFESGKRDTSRKIQSVKRSVDAMRRAMESYTQIQNIINATKDAPFQIEIMGEILTERKDAEEAITRYIPTFPLVNNETEAARTHKVLGTFRNFKLIGYTQKSFSLSNRPMLAIVNENDPGFLEVRTESGSLRGLEGRMRHVQSNIGQYEDEIANNEASITRMTASLDNQFQQEEQLQKVRERLTYLQNDIQANPVPPPSWLRQGAPVHSSVIFKGEEHNVTGHLWNDNGWYVMLEDEKGGPDIPAPYMEVLDDQGANLYEERDFEAPVLVEAAEEENDDDTRYRTVGMPGFYSPAARAVEAMKQDTFTPAQLKGTLQNAPGVKAEELVDLGLFDWLDGVAGETVSKAEVMAFINSAGPQVVEVVKGDRPPRPDIKSDVADEAWSEMEDGYLEQAEKELDYETFDTEKWESNYTQDQVRERARNKFESDWESGQLDDWLQARHEDTKGPKFSKYQLPGGENYREVLLTLPSRFDEDAYRKKVERMTDEQIRDEYWRTQRIEPEWGLGRKAVIDYLVKYGQDKEITSQTASGDYKSSHWDEPNVLAHVRLNDRTGPNGEKVLFVEEIQSDWHQEGRKRGYGEEWTWEVLEEGPLAIPMRVEEGLEMLEGTFDKESDAIAFQKKYGGEIRKIKSQSGVPKAPFKKSWAMLAFKRVLRMAAEQGYDSVAWTPGNVQAERYNLSKQVESVRWYKKPDGTKHVEIPFRGADQLISINVDSNGVVSKGSLSGREAPYIGKSLDEVIGKNIAKQIMEDEKGILKGDGLKVGGEGMKGFYDKILPTEVGKYVRKLDKAAKVEVGGAITNPVGGWTVLFNGKPLINQRYNTRQDAATVARQRGLTGDGYEIGQVDVQTQEVWTLPITDAMRTQIMEGQSLYRDTAAQTAPLTSGEKRRATRFIRRILGDAVNIEFVTGRLMTPEGRRALGKYRAAWITLAEGPGMADTALHEAVHAALDLFLDPGDRAKLLDSVRQAGDTGLQAEERLAENFVRYAHNRSGFRANVKRFAAKVLRILKALFGGPTPPVDRVTKFYDDLMAGKVRRGGAVKDSLTTRLAAPLLSRRFNEDSPDIRFRTEDRMVSYDTLPAVTRSDIEQELTDRFGTESPENELFGLEKPPMLATRTVPASSIQIPDSDNRAISEKALAAYRKMKSNPPPILVDGDVLVDGAHRLKVAQENGADIDVVDVGPLFRAWPEWSEGGADWLETGMEPRYRTEAQAAETEKVRLSFDDAVDFTKRLLKRRDDSNARPDISKADTLLRTISHYSAKVPALRRLFEAAQRLRDDKHLYGEHIFGEGERDQGVLNTFAKNNPDAATALKQYLFQRDLDAVGYTVRDEGGGRFSLLDPGGRVVSSHDSQEIAWESAFRAEALDYERSTGNTEAAAVLQTYRQIGNRMWNQLNTEALAWKARMEELNLPFPQVDGQDLFDMLKEMGDRRGHYMPRLRKSGQWVLKATKDGANPIREHFDTKGGRKVRAAALERQGYAVEFEVNTRPSEEAYLDANLVAMNDLIKNAMTNLDASAELVNLDDFSIPYKRISYTRKDGTSEPHFILAAEYRSGWATVFKAFGGQFYDDKQTGNGKVWHFANPPDNIQKQLAEAMFAHQHGVIEPTLAFAKMFTKQVAEVIHSRGSRARKIGRSDATGENVPLGYEKDAFKAMTMAGKATAGGTAKRKMAKDMMKIITGTDVEWAEFRDRHIQDNNLTEDPGALQKAWKAYRELVDERRIDSATQPNAYKEALSFSREMLRNEEPIERMMGAVRGVAALKHLSGIAPGVVNMSALVTTVPAAMKAFGDIPVASTLPLLQRGMDRYIRHYIHARYGKGEALTGEDAWLMREISSRGWDDALQNEEAIRALQNQAQQMWSKIIDKALIVFSVTERINRGSTIAAAYYGLRERGMDQDQALQQAKEISDKAHGIYGKSNLPAWARGSDIGGQAMRAFYMYKTFSHNYLQVLGEMIGKRDLKATAYMLLSPAILAGGGASIAAPVLSAMAKGVAEALGMQPPDDPEEEFYRWAEETFGDTAGRFARTGVAGLAGVNLKGSLSIGIAEILPTDFDSLLGAPYSLFVDAAKGTASIARGDISKGIETLVPRFVASPIRAYREATEGVTSRNNQPLYYGNDRLKASFTDAVLRALSFNPADISIKRERQWKEREAEMRYTEARTDLYARMRRFAHTGGDSAEWADILTDVELYNARVRRSGFNSLPFITPASIKRTFTTVEKAPRREKLRAGTATRTDPGEIDFDPMEDAGGRRRGVNRRTIRREMRRER